MVLEVCELCRFGKVARTALEGSLVSMSTRTSLMACLLACLLGCPAAEEDKAATDEVALTGELHAEGDETFDITAGDMVELSVRLVDLAGAPIVAQEIEFGLTDSPEGASLSDASVRTDEDGVATTTLIAGRAAAPFRVRASADGLKDVVYFNITVAAAPTGPSVPIVVAYDGVRPIKTYSFVIVDGMTCDQLRANATDVRMSRTIMKEETLEFYPGSGRSYAIAGWASDDSNSKLAFGCAAYPGSAGQVPPRSVEVKLEDIVFTAATPIPLSFSVNTQPLLATLAPLARTVVMDALPKTSTPQASFLLDLLQAKVSIATARNSEGLDAVLQQLLDAASSGPLRFADAHAAAVAQDGAMCMLQGTMTPVGETGASTLMMTASIYAVPSDSLAKEVSMVPLKGVTEFDASYNADTAVVKVRTLKVGLGFGSYAAYLSKAVAEQVDRTSVAASTGCIELKTLLAQRPASFAGLTQDDALSACQGGVSTLVTNIRNRWIALDAERNTIAMAGDLSVHDRDGDKKIDDLGPAKLEGSWSTAAGNADPKLEISVRMAAATANAR